MGKLDLSQNDYKTLGGRVKAEHSGVRVDRYLASEFPFFSRSSWRKRIDWGWVRVDRVPVSASYLLRAGQQMFMYHPEENEPEIDKSVRVIHKVGAVLFAYKPPNLPMHEGGPYRKNVFARLIQEVAGDEWAAVHRLDRETSGLVVCGATYEVRKRLGLLFRGGEVKKQYLALCRGVSEKEAWAVDGPIGDLPESKIRIKKWVVAGGQEAYTKFVVEARSDSFTLVRAYPRTGRTNQIRIHAAYSGLPLLGDKLFYPDEDVFIEFHEQGMTSNVLSRVGHSRCCLHATAVGFIHPETAKWVEASSGLPPDMCGILHGARS